MNKRHHVFAIGALRASRFSAVYPALKNTCLRKKRNPQHGPEPPASLGRPAPAAVKAFDTKKLAHAAHAKSAFSLIRIFLASEISYRVPPRLLRLRLNTAQVSAVAGNSTRNVPASKIRHRAEARAPHLHGL